MEQPNGDTEESYSAKASSANPRVAPIGNPEGENEEEAKSRQGHGYEGEDEVEHTLRVFWDFVKQTFREAKPGERLTAWLTVVLIFSTLAVAIIYYLQLRQMRRATDLNTNVLLATQAAVFDCESRFDVSAARLVTECTNRGQIAARHITGTIVFSKAENGVEVESVRRIIDSPAIIKGGNIDKIFPVSGLQSGNYAQWLTLMRDRKTSFQIVLSFTFYDGVTNSRMDSCWASIYDSNSFGMTDCDNAKAINDAEHRQ